MLKGENISNLCDKEQIFFIKNLPVRNKQICRERLLSFTEKE